MSAMWTIKRGQIAVASVGLLSAWACTVVDKGDYTFTDSPGHGGEGATAGSSAAGGTTGGSGGRLGTAGSKASGGRGGRSGSGATGGTSGNAGESGAAGEAGAGATGGKGGSGGNAGAAGESGGGQGGAAPNDCGNDVVDPGEQCDLGSANGDTACTYGQMSCTVCTTTCTRTAGKPTYCGDGKIQASHEQCDDGNTVTEPCTYGASSCSGCDATCQTIIPRSCGDNTINGDIPTSITLEYTGLWAETCDSKSMPFFINGVPIPSVPQTSCTCTATTIGNVTVTDPAVLDAIRPSGNVFEIRSNVSGDETYFGWATLTVNTTTGALPIVTINPNDYALDGDLCSPNSPVVGSYASAPFDVSHIEQCDGGAKCSACTTPLAVSGFSGAAGPPISGWTQCAGYYDTPSPNDIPDGWGSACKVNGYNQLLLACGDSLSHFRYITVGANLLRDGIPTADGNQIDDIVTGAYDQDGAVFATTDNFVYANNPATPDTGVSWWSNGNGCSETSPNITINNMCSWEVANCFGQNLSGNRYLWVYMQ
jgi:hypothetical protein